MSPNVLLIVLDAGRAQNFQLYGHVNETTPYLSSLESKATVYTQARSPSTWSLPSHTSMFTGLEVPEHCVTSRNDRLSAGHTIWETLQENGYETGVFSENPFITSNSYGLTRGFNTVISGIITRQYPFSEATNPNAFFAESEHDDAYHRYFRYAAAHGKPLRSIANAVIRQMEISAKPLVPSSLQTSVGNPSRAHANSFLDWQAGKSNWAACLNLTDVHHPYTPTSTHDQWGGASLRTIHDNLDDPRWDFHSGRQPWWKRQALTGLYDGCIHQVDDAIKTIVETLTDRDQLNETLIVITADHGEGFGEQSRVRPGFRIAGHSGGIHELLVHVPLLVKYPGQTDGERIERAASLTEFPSVVRSVCSGKKPHEGFVPDGPVVAVNEVAGQFETPPTNFTNYCDEIGTETFTGIARAVYRHRKHGCVRKFVQWDADEAVVDVFNPQNAMSVPGVTTVNDEIAAAFDPLESVGVRESIDEMGDDTKQRLADLGYL